jgi:hypothetical protein
MKNAYKIFVGKLNGKRHHSEDLGLVGGIVLN